MGSCIRSPIFGVTRWKVVRMEKRYYCNAGSAVAVEKQDNVTSKEVQFKPLSKEAFRQVLANTLERRFFYKPSFDIYGGVAGLYNYGPPGSAVKANVIAYWDNNNL
ncbi:hypothetical protein KI387_002058, partial [Taxus chinensis]